MRNLAISTPELIQCSHGILFGENTPKLPAPPLLAFDEVIEISGTGGKYGQGFAVARKDLSDMGWVFKSHFESDPVMPGTMMVEGLLQLTGFFGAYLGAKGTGRAAKVDDVKFLAEVMPSDKEIFYRIDVRKRSAGNSLLITEGKVTAGGIDRTSVGQLWVIIKRTGTATPTPTVN
ncbi:MAG TPA: bifunctional 3-hydroxydecanoyl-ACP dehydratase/trans-2-decenoyl-ACP isomerase [Pirellulales bacterium]|nr:bifunctional 3-hydroxydecanoyl-ACP dehydratase/trans-2-decenoyl-ACP isomerase [Pirellulales bacterium]